MDLSRINFTSPHHCDTYHIARTAQIPLFTRGPAPYGSEKEMRGNGKNQKGLGITL